MARLFAFLLLFFAPCAWGFDPAPVEAGLAGMASTTFTAQRRAEEAPSDVRAWRDAGDVRKVAVSERGDRGTILTEYFYEGGQLAAWRGGAQRSPLTRADGASAEGAERLAAAGFYREAARLSFDRQARNEQRSLCGEAEDAVFACRVGGKLASVCVSKDAARDRGTLRLRVGIAGSRLPDEIRAPTRALPPALAASGESVAFSGGGGSWLRIREGDTAYVAYSGIGRWGPQGEAREKQGIVVERGGKAVAHLRCTERYETLPDGEWFGRMGITATGAGFDFPD